MLSAICPPPYYWGLQDGKSLHVFLLSDNIAEGPTLSVPTNGPLLVCVLLQPFVSFSFNPVKKKERNKERKTCTWM